MISLQLLLRFPVFAGLDKSDLKELARTAHEVAMAARHAEHLAADQHPWTPDHAAIDRFFQFQVHALHPAQVPHRGDAYLIVLFDKLAVYPAPSKTLLGRETSRPLAQNLVDANCHSVHHRSWPWDALLADWL